MRRWKRVVLGLGVLLAAAAALILWVSRSQPAPSLSLAFLGYTNRSITTSNFPSLDVSNPSSATTAIVGATNVGPVSVQLLSVVSRAQPGNKLVSWNPLITFSPGDGSAPLCWPGILKPGETLIFEIYLPPEFDSWSGDMLVSRLGLYERTYVWAWSSGNPTTQRWVTRILPGIRTDGIKLGPFTNQPAAGGILNR